MHSQVTFLPQILSKALETARVGVGGWVGGRAKLTPTTPNTPPNNPPVFRGGAGRGERGYLQTLPPQDPCIPVDFPSDLPPPHTPTATPQPHRTLSCLLEFPPRAEKIAGTLGALEPGGAFFVVLVLVS